MSRLFTHPLFKKPGFSVFITIVFIGIFSLSYYIYSSLSVHYLKREFTDHFLQLKQEISTKIEKTQEAGEAVNINRIVEPYLSQQIDLLAVYGDDGEIIQIFTKKGITRENLKELNEIYTSNQDETMNLFFWESGQKQDLGTEINSKTQGIHDLSLLALTVIYQDYSGGSYRYLLVFNLDNYKKQLVKLEDIINRNIFYGGLILLGLIGFIFMLNERQQAKKNKQSKQEYSRSLVKRETHQVSEANEAKAKIGADAPMIEVPQNEEETEATGSADKNKKEVSINDQIIHDQDDELFGEDLIKKNWIGKLSDSSTETQNETGSIRDLYDQTILPLREAKYEAVIDVFSQNPTSNQTIRPFSNIIEYGEYLKQGRLKSPQLKSLLGIWLFTQSLQMGDFSFQEDISNQDSLSENENNFTFELIRRSFGVISNPKQTDLGVSLLEYPPPAALLYFYSEGPKSNSQSSPPTLTVTFPEYLYDKSLTLTTVPWLAQEKNFFKRGLPYTEKKSQATAIVIPFTIRGIPHIVKAVYSSKDYEGILYEQKLELIYLLEVMLNLLENFFQLRKQLFEEGLLEKKVEYLFNAIFKMESTVVNLLTGNKENPVLHLSLWTFEKKSYPQDVEIQFRDMMSLLPESLHREFYGETVIFLTDGNRNKSRLLSVGYNYEEVSLGGKIKDAIEKILVEKVGMGVMQLNWKETPLNIPDPGNPKINFPEQA